jgi:L-fuconolactonase
MPEVAPVAVDAHQHVWDPARAEYPWMTPALDRLRRPFDHADVIAEQTEVGVGATVLVQAADNLEDTANMLRVARAHPQVAGVVAWVPLDDPVAAARLLDGWQRAAEPVVGVRHLVHREADPNWLLRSEVQDGLAGLSERALTFEVCAETAPLLRHVPALAERHPALSLVVDHLGKPPIRARGWQPWADLLAAAAEAPNVTAKVSGLNTAADPDRWSSADFQPYVVGTWSDRRGGMLGHLVGGRDPARAGRSGGTAWLLPPPCRSVLVLDRLTSAGAPTSSRLGTRGSACHANDARISISAVVVGGSGGSP